jgi:hypothetical protein
MTMGPKGETILMKEFMRIIPSVPIFTGSFYAAQRGRKGKYLHGNER